MCGSYWVFIGDVVFFLVSWTTRFPLSCSFLFPATSCRTQRPQTIVAPKTSTRHHFSLNGPIAELSFTSWSEWNLLGVEYDDASRLRLHYFLRSSTSSWRSRSLPGRVFERMSDEVTMQVRSNSMSPPPSTSILYPLEVKGTVGTMLRQDKENMYELLTKSLRGNRRNASYWSLA